VMLDVEHDELSGAGFLLGHPLTINDRPAVYATTFTDVEAGAFFRVTPQLRVGGAVGVGPQLAPVRKPGDNDEAPRVRLETAFKF